MTVHISRSLAADLLSRAASTPELEVCGLLFGADGRIDHARPCLNIAEHPDSSFEIDPAALIAAHRAGRSGGAVMIGHYHSHPVGAAAPSPRDLAAAAGDGAIWLIIGGGTITGWRSDAAGSLSPVAVEMAGQGDLPAANFGA
ncbi:Mov34/MPN/PAD-1 family protein [uncultured Sphingomonas sp.]|uniref:Mov34/MPN/PAD-1 family protein n=1 Tax=uncultured Sphingomonas sp. TaxID=158754 RepID=UPI0035C9F1C8